ncbi:MAG: hypothetical protein U0984_14990 [Prosthecobacter sp.]|nr:hypothetical protein [Prosthecobacter sp.]
MAPTSLIQFLFDGKIKVPLNLLFVLALVGIHLPGAGRVAANEAGGPRLQQISQADAPEGAEIRTAARKALAPDGIPLCGGGAAPWTVRGAQDHYVVCVERGAWHWIIGQRGVVHGRAPPAAV